MESKGLSEETANWTEVFQAIGSKGRQTMAGLAAAMGQLPRMAGGWVMTDSREQWTQAPQTAESLTEPAPPMPARIMLLRGILPTAGMISEEAERAIFPEVREEGPVMA